MNRSDDDFRNLIVRYADGLATLEEIDRLQQCLLESAENRRIFRCYMELDDSLERLALLETGAETAIHVRNRFRPPIADRSRPGNSWSATVRVWIAMAFGACLLLAVGAYLATRSTSPAWAKVVDAGPGLSVLRSGRTIPATPGLALIEGDLIRQQGSPGKDPNLRFESGGELRLFDGAVLQPLSGNSAFLQTGQVAAVAETPASKGFLLKTETSNVIDLGTSFIAAVAADGQSRVDVSSGAVNVQLAGVPTLQHLKSGDALCVEPGTRQIMTRIESGDETAAFRFPTIPPPSSEDYADRSHSRATIRVARGQLYVSDAVASGPATVLIDGRAQTHEDAPEESVYFENKKTGSLLMDLGRVVSIRKINSYSWHQNTTHDWHRHRAVQKFTLYGFAGDEPPPANGGHREQAGWVRIARVDSDDYFRVTEPLKRPAQQACSITSPHGEIGRYRYLLWAVEPTEVPKVVHGLTNTFYGEIDVYANIVP